MILEVSTNWVFVDPYDDEYIKTAYRNHLDDDKRRFKTSDLTAAKEGGDTGILMER